MSDAAAQFDRYCHACRHSLRGIESVKCPECGRAFDPNDPTTTRDRPATINYERLAALARTIVVLFAVYAGMLILLSATGMDPWYVLGCLSLATSIVWIPAVLILAVLVLWPKVALRRRDRLFALIVPVIIVSIHLTNWPFAITFQAQRRAFDKVADDVEGGYPYKTPSRIGVFPIQRIRVHTNGNVGFQIGGGTGGGNYIVRVVEGQTSPWIWYNTNYEYPMGGGWYFVYED